MRIAAFILALLLLSGDVDPTRGWLIALVVMTGLAVTRLHHGNIWRFRPVVDARVAGFVIAILLLAGAVDPTRSWLIGLTVATGIALVSPRLGAVDPLGLGGWERDRHMSWDRWERRMDRHWRRHAERFGDDWS